MSYDEFEATMSSAGWSLDEIEAQWQKYLKESPDSYETQDTWDAPEFDRD